MARRIMDFTHRSQTPDLSALRAEMARLRSEIAAAAEGGTRRARARTSSLGEAASDRVAELQHEAEALLASASRELAQLEARAGAAVRAHPLQSVGLALVVGFLIALVIRR